ncbi:MAG TPA: hypothetical protein VFA03_00720 [Acetobacteraceae bacterium]|nr:hypothetical protein [Acetobacteraceae bacterium]
MKKIMLATAMAFALSGGVALAQSGGGNGPAIGNDTTTSLGAPKGSPGYTAPRSEAVPGLPAQTRMAQEYNEHAQPPTNQSPTAPVQGPKNPLTGHTQTNP